MNHRRIRAILWAAVPGFCLGGRSLVKLKDDSSAFYSSTVLAGYVTSAVPWDKPVVVAAYARHGSDGLPDIVHHALLHEAGGYELIVPKGDYTVFAFGDANGNLALDVGEPFGVYTTVPVRAGGEPIVVPISALDSGRELGPFPAGAYRAGLVARAFRSTPASVPVTIGAGAAADLAFVLAPQGTLSGYIGADVTSADNPAGSFREGRRDIAIESIVLTDGTDRREIRPAGDTRDCSFDAYLAGQDYAFGSFRGAGEVRLPGPDRSGTVAMSAAGRFSGPPGGPGASAAAACR
nr:hypothetical protein [uncultured Duganella sp.]